MFRNDGAALTSILHRSTTANRRPIQPTVGGKRLSVTWRGHATVLDERNLKTVRKLKGIEELTVLLLLVMTVTCCLLFMIDWSLSRLNARGQLSTFASLSRNVGSLIYGRMFW